MNKENPLVFQWVKARFYKTRTGGTKDALHYGHGCKFSWEEFYMTAIKRLVLCMTFLVLALAPQVSFADELLVRHSVLLAESDGRVVQGTVEVVVILVRFQDETNCGRLWAWQDLVLPI